MKTNTQRAQVARINRRLAKRDERLLTSRGAKTIQNLGDYHLVDMRRNALVDSHVNLDELEAELAGE
jgi:hypothetical protein